MKLENTNIGAPVTNHLLEVTSCSYGYVSVSYRGNTCFTITIEEAAALSRDLRVISLELASGTLAYIESTLS